MSEDQPFLSGYVFSKHHIPFQCLFLRLCMALQKHGKVVDLKLNKNVKYTNFFLIQQK